MLRRILLGIGGLLILALVAVLGFAWWIGAWGILFPSTSHDTTPPAIAAEFGQGASLRVLVYSKTNSFRHTEGIAAAHALVDRLAAERGWAVFHSENSAALSTETLAHFDVVVFASPTGDHASEGQEAEFQRWLESGGGWFGIHAAGDGSHADWNWYARTLMTGTYLGHILGPQTQEARVVVERGDHPVTRGLPAEFQHEEEWYSWDRGAREAGFEVLLTVDESSYSPFIRGMGQEKDIAMGDHPIVWTRCVERGRAVYTAMGHWGAAYEQDTMRDLVRNTIEWVGEAGREGCKPAVSTATP